jgi:hypothetical protein
MKKVRSLIDRKLVERLNHVDDLTKIIFAAIGLPENKHQIWAVKDLRKITILTNDSILATRLRLDHQQIINYINNHSALVVDSIQVKMTMPEMTRRETSRTTFSLSEKSAKTISCIANSIEDDELRESLLRISKLI